jgi:phosphatidylcholine synthase
MDRITAGARAAGWLVHAYTTTGVVLALLMVHFAYEGRIEAVLWLFLAAMVVDGTDGFAARYFKVKTVVPSLDGALLDNIVDYLTYAFAPMVLLWANGYLPDGAWGGVLAASPLVASCYQFCRSDAKTDDHFFLGFPSYWNVAAFYIIVMEFSVTATTWLLVVLAILVFVPVKYVYPSRTLDLWWFNMSMATAWLVLFGVVVAQLPDPNPWLIGISLAYPAVYLVESLWLTAKTAGSNVKTRVQNRQAAGAAARAAATPPD